MITRTVTIEDKEYTLKPLTRRQFKALYPADENTMERALAASLDAVVVEALEDEPFYVSKQLFDECLDLTSGGKAEKNS